MPMTSTPLTVAAALALLGMVSPVRADEAAETLLKKAEAATQAVQSLTADYTETYETSRGPLSGWSNSVKLLKPNFCRLDIRMAGPDKATGVWKTTDSAIIVSDGKSRWQYGYRRNDYKIGPVDPRARGLNLVDIRPLIDFFDPSVSWWSQVQKIRAEGHLKELKVASPETWEGEPFQVVELVSISDTFYTDDQLKAFPGGIALKKDRFYIGADSLVHRLVESGPTERIFDFQFHHLKVGVPLTKADFAYAPPADAKPAAPPPPLLSPGLTAPAFVADSTTGAPIKLEDYRGKVVVLDFWATWCQPCQKALPHLRKVYDAVQGKEVVFLGVCVWDDRKAFDGWLLKNSVKYPFVFTFDPSGRDSANSIPRKLYSVNGIPATYVLDRDGKIAASFDDYIEGDTRLETALRKLHVDVADQKEEPTAH